MKVRRLLFSAPMFVFSFGAAVAILAISNAVVSGLFGTSERSLASTRQLSPEKIEEPVLPVAATPEKAREPNKDYEYDFSAHGYFYLDVEKIPKAFEDIDHLEVTTIDYDKTNADGTDGVPIPPKGLLKTTKEFKFTRIAIYDRQIEFQTETIAGVSYRFSGRYSTPEDYERDSSLSDLTGRLIKIKKGKWAAEMTAGFMWPGC